MAMHEYECPDCGFLDAKLFFGSEIIPEKVQCSECGTSWAKRVISGGSFTVKQGQCGNAESGYSDARNTKPQDQKRAMGRAKSEAAKLNRGQNPR